jgi:hypothetical protein
MSNPIDPVESWFERRFATLDMAGLTDAERKSGSIFLGGSAKQFVVPGDDFEYGQVREVVFNWGDPKAEDTFALMLEHDDRPGDTEAEGYDLIPFSAATRLRDELWSLVIQRKSFNPDKDYEDPSHYIQIPFEAEAGYRSLREALDGPRPTPQIIGKVGIAWVLFEMGMNIGENDPAHQEMLDISLENREAPINELLDDAEKIIDAHDFEHSSKEENNRFATHMVFWLLESFAQHDDDGEYLLYPHHEGDGFKGKKLPTAMKSLVLHQWQGKPFYSDGNEVKMESDFQFETIQEAHLPIDTEGMTMQQIVDYFNEHPEEAALIQQQIMGYIPQIKLTLQPKEHNGWDLEFTVNPMDISILPLIDSRDGSSVMNIPSYIREAMTHPAELARSVCELALLAARYTDHVRSGKIPMEKLLILQDRLAGKVPLPLIKGRSYASWSDSRFIQLPIDPDSLAT